MKPGNRKTLQLCAQVRRAIEMALLAQVDDDLLEDLEVESVVPTANPGRLLVMFVAGERAASGPRQEVVARLEAARPAMVDEVARSIHRRKVPELGFEVVKRKME